MNNIIRDTEDKTLTFVSEMFPIINQNTIVEPLSFYGDAAWKILTKKI